MIQLGYKKLASWEVVIMNNSIFHFIKVSDAFLTEGKKHIRKTNFNFFNKDIKFNFIIKICALSYLNIFVTLLFIVLLPFGWIYKVMISILLQLLLPLLIVSLKYREEIINNL